LQLSMLIEICPLIFAITVLIGDIYVLLSL